MLWLPSAMLPVLAAVGGPSRRRVIGGLLRGGDVFRVRPGHVPGPHGRAQRHLHRRHAIILHRNQRDA